MFHQKLLFEIEYPTHLQRYNPGLVYVTHYADGQGEEPGRSGRQLPYGLRIPGAAAEQALQTGELVQESPPLHRRGYFAHGGGRSRLGVGVVGLAELDGPQEVEEQSDAVQGVRHELLDEAESKKKSRWESGTSRSRVNYLFIMEKVC